MDESFRIPGECPDEASARSALTFAGSGASVRNWRGGFAAGPGEEMAVLRLNERGMICDSTPAAEAMFNYRRSELVWRHVSMLLPQLGELDLLQNGQPNPRLRFLCRIGRHFQAVTHDGEHFESDLSINLLDSNGHRRLLLIVRPSDAATGHPTTSVRATDTVGSKATSD